MADELKPNEENKALADSRQEAKKHFKTAQEGIYSQFAAEHQDYNLNLDADSKEENDIIIDTSTYNPKLDPRSEEFDAALYEQFLEEHHIDIDKIGTQLAALFSETAQKVQEVYDPQMLQTALLAFNNNMQMLQETIYPVADGIKTFLKSDTWQGIRETIRKIKENMPTLEELDYYNKFFLALEYEIKKPIYKNISLEDLEEQGRKENGDIIQGSLFEKAVSNAHLLVDAMEIELQKPPYNAQTFLEIKKQGVNQDGNIIEKSTLDALIKSAEKTLVPATRFKKPPHYQLTTDKIDNTIWKNLIELDPTGQYKLIVPVTPSNRKLAKQTGELNEVVNLTFEDIPKDVIKNLNLTPFDRRVHNAIGTLYNFGNTVITLSQIHRQMGGKTKPSANQINKIYQSVIKMMHGVIEIDSLDEAKAYKNKDRYLSITAHLLPIELGAEHEITNGKVTDFAMHITSELPLFKVARAKGQVENIPLELLQSNLSMTDANLAMQEYILDRITEMQRNRTKSNKILYSSLYDETKANTKKKKFDLKKAFFRYLQELADKKFIEAYRETTTESTGELGVEITFYKK